MLVAAPAADARPDPGGAGSGNREVAVEMPESSYVPFVTDFPRTAQAPGGDGTAVDYPRVEGRSRRERLRLGDAFIGAGGTLALVLVAGSAGAREASREPALDGLRSERSRRTGPPGPVRPGHRFS